MDARESDVQDRVQAWLGTAVMLVASIFAILIFADRMKIDFVSLPAVWSDSRRFHLVICGALFFMAAMLLRSPAPPTSSNHRLLFWSCRLFTRQDCHLCEDALSTLLRFQDVLPTIEIVEIDKNAQLIRQFGESVPVVELDGRIRFRGAVNPVLLRRMADAAKERLRQPEAASPETGISSSGLITEKSPPS